MACGWFGKESLAQARPLSRRIFGQVAENGGRGEAAGAVAEVLNANSRASESQKKWPQPRADGWGHVGRPDDALSETCNA